MFLSSFDILRKDRRGKPILLAVAEDLETACLRLRQLASLMPGEYFVFDPRTSRIICVHPRSEQADAFVRQNVYLAPEVRSCMVPRTSDGVLPVPQNRRESEGGDIDATGMASHYPFLNTVAR